MIPMKFTDITADQGQIDRLLVSSEWVAEQKMDGTRVLVHVMDDGVSFHNSAGSSLSHTAATQHIAALVAPLRQMLPGPDYELWIDGELMIDSGEYRLFDLPYCGPTYGGAAWVGTVSPFYERRQVLESLFTQADEGRLTLVYQATEEGAKRELLHKVTETGCEGIMLKHRVGTYETGKRSKSGLKVKLVKTADVIVTEVNRPDPKHGNFTFGVVTGPSGYIEVLGKCSAIGKSDAKVGDVIEVAYLYRQETGGLVQPRMLRIRDDKTPAECDLSQFPTYSRQAVR